MTFVKKYFRFQHLIIISTFRFKPFCGTCAPAKKQHCKDFCHQAPKDPNFSSRIIIGNEMHFQSHLITSRLEASIDFHPMESSLNKSAKTEASAAQRTLTKTPLTMHASILTNLLITFCSRSFQATCNLNWQSIVESLCCGFDSLLLR